MGGKSGATDSGADETAFSAFLPEVAGWFAGRYGAPTEAQRRAWPLIKRGRNVLIHSPTGSGKTLAAFLSAIDSCYRRATDARVRGVKVLYVSPLRALNYDIERNLREPIRGIAEALSATGSAGQEVSVGVRTGDTPSAERARMVRNPPEILITTPESLYLILTSPRARDVLRTVETVIVDEIHTMCSNKRGVHLSVSLERLERLSPGFQRIGLSATQRPLSEVAKLLGGRKVSGDSDPKARDVQVVDCAGRSDLDVKVIGMPESDAAGHADSVWEGIIPRVLDDVESHDTTLVFTNSRRQAENTADRLNQVLVARDSGADEGSAVGSGERGSGISGGPFLAHHGSISDAMRRQIEDDLKHGRLPALVGTSSLELGIDIGSIDMVVQLQSPKSVAQGLQRVGRAGHQVGATSYAKVYATHAEDLMEATVVAKGMLDGDIEAMHIPSNALDVLAQHVVSAVALEDWKLRDLYDVVRGAYPYAGLAYSTFESVVRLVSGHFPKRHVGSFKARVHWDRTRDVLCALPGTRMFAVAHAGAIVDRGAFRVVLPDRKTTVGELDEEFVYESTVGDVFVLGSQVWRAIDIDDDRVVAEPAPGSLPRTPFWRGEYPWRPSDLGIRYGQFRAEVADRLRPHVDEPHDPPELIGWLTRDYPIDEVAARQIIGHVRSQLASCGAMSSDKEIVVESYRDDLGDWRIVVHSPFGGRVNGPWSVAAVKEMSARGYVEPESQVNDDGFMLRLADTNGEPPVSAITAMTSDVVKRHVLDGILDSPMFGATFRQNASRSLLMPSVGFGRRTPFWLQRLRSKDLLSVARGLPDFPVLLETYRDVMEDVMDLPGLVNLIDRIHGGDVKVVQTTSRVPSPAARSLEFRFIDHWMYQWDTPNAERALQTLSADREALVQLFKHPDAAGLLRPEALPRRENGAGDGSREVRSATELSQLQIDSGDLFDDEIRECCGAEWSQWLDELSEQGRAVQIEIPTSLAGLGRRWISAGDRDTYAAVLEGAADVVALADVLARYIQRCGPLGLSELAARYQVGEAHIDAAIDLLVEEGIVACGYFTRSDEREVIGLASLEEVRARTLAILRSEVEPVTPLRYQQELLDRHGVRVGTRLEGTDGVLEVIRQLQGVALTPAVWMAEVFPARVRGFSARMLDEALRLGDVYWVFSGGDSTDKVAFVLAREGRVALSNDAVVAATESDISMLDASLRELYAFIASEGVVSTSDIEISFAGANGASLPDSLAELARRGLVTCDSWNAAQAIATRSVTAAKPLAYPARRPMVGGNRRRRSEFARRVKERRSLAPRDATWSATNRIALLGVQRSDDELAAARANILLERHGVVTRQSLRRDELGWDWRSVYAALSLMELRGEVRRGYFVGGLGGVQFASNDFVESLRERDDAERGRESLAVIRTSDPAWILDREMLGDDDSVGAELLRDNKLAGATVVTSDRPLVVAHAQCSRVHVPDDADETEIVLAVRLLVEDCMKSGASARVRVREWNGDPVLQSEGAAILESAGFRRDYPYMVADALTRMVRGAGYH